MLAAAAQYETKLSGIPGYLIRFMDPLGRVVCALEVWDLDARRWQAALGYRITHNLEVRGEYMWNHTDGSREPRDNLLSLQCRFQF